MKRNLSIMWIPSWQTGRRWKIRISALEMMWWEVRSLAVCGSMPVRLSDWKENGESLTAENYYPDWSRRCFWIVIKLQNKSVDYILGNGSNSIKMIYWNEKIPDDPHEEWREYEKSGIWQEVYIQDIFSELIQDTQAAVCIWRTGYTGRKEKNWDWTDWQQSAHRAAFLIQCCWKNNRRRAICGENTSCRRCRKCICPFTCWSLTG